MVEFRKRKSKNQEVSSSEPSSLSLLQACWKMPFRAMSSFPTGLALSSGTGRRSIHHANYKRNLRKRLGYTAESNLNREISDTNMIHARSSVSCTAPAKRNLRKHPFRSGIRQSEHLLCRENHLHDRLSGIRLPENLQTTDRQGGERFPLLQNFGNKADIKYCTPLPARRQLCGHGKTLSETAGA